MVNMFASPGPQLTFVRDPTAVEATAHQHRPDLAPGGNLPLSSRCLAAHRDHVGRPYLLVTTDPRTNRPAGMLAAYDCAADGEPFLLVETAFSCAQQDTVMFARRLIALTIADMIQRGLPHSLIAARAHTPALCIALYDLSRRIAAAAFYPEPGSNVVALMTASVAHRIARSWGEPMQFDATAAAMLRAGARGRRPAKVAVSTEAAGPLFAVLDLRSTSEAALVEGVRWLYRSRRPRGRFVPRDDVSQHPATVSAETAQTPAV